ncbi:heterokaryon incompatibility protein-domain-containing protein [Fusarium venenatum]|uniref:heterokaryon incompatibility protein-domain-containing protein n=1 Tax=Fusarium venenatum TaxID=56646 RepID=UPI001DA2EC38|nr:heterokaryon incompatibility protein-domain-containing protein [Fusarium venenatum]
MPNHDVDAPKTVAKTELGLSYSRNDELPDLLALGDTASAGRELGKREGRRKGKEDEQKEEIEEDTKEQEEGDATDVEDSEGDDDVDDDDTDAEENKEEEAIVETLDKKTEGIGEEKGERRGKKTRQRPRLLSNSDLQLWPQRYYPEKQNWSPPRLPTSSKIDYQGKKRRYSIHFNMYAEESDPCTSWLEIKRWPIISDTLSLASLRRMNELIRLPEEEQPVKVVKKPFLPTRLLDVQASCPSGLRLVITKTDSDVCMLNASLRRYAALSYCWGSGNAALKQLMTTKDVLQKHLDEIHMENVPLTIADSIRVCRALDVRYLWVDALCILLGDRDDWPNESGFLHKDYSTPNVRVKFQSKLHNSVSGNITLRMLHPPSVTVRRCTKQVEKYGRADDSAGNSDINEALWSTRGWTFQEDQLARGRCSTCGAFVLSRQWILLELGLETWYTMIENNSEKNLSYENDKFPAIAALIRSFSEKFKNQAYLAGLWESDIHKGLIWTCTSAWKEFDDFQRLLSKEHTVPSWSWAHRPLLVNWILNHDKRPKSELIVRGSEIVALDKHNDSSCISEGRLLLKARIFKPPTRRNGKIRIKHSYNLWRDMNLPSFNYILWSKSNKYMVKIRFDWNSQSCFNDEG